LTFEEIGPAALSASSASPSLVVSSTAFEAVEVDVTRATLLATLASDGPPRLRYRLSFEALSDADRFADVLFLDDTPGLQLTYLTP